MRTASRNWLVIIFLTTAGGAWAQNTTPVPDTIIYSTPSQEIQRTPFERFWTKPRIVPKLGVGAMDRAFVELGVQWHSIYRHPLTLLSHGPYSTVDVFIDDSNILLGPKL